MVHPAFPSRPAKQRARLHLSISTCLASLALPGAAFATGALPTGGTVAAGAASIAGGANSVTITQSTQNAVINWQAFSVGQGQSVVFNQPTAQSATLNRVTGTTTSTIAGQITSNGAVYLVNPNGIAITGTGAVQTGGGFVASTLDIAAADFMAGKLNFAGTGASRSVTNSGSIRAGQGAYVALLGGSVANAGLITVPLGKVGLGSGEQVALDLNGGGFMQVAVPTALVTGARALVDDSGAIVVSGGSVTLSAAVVKNAVRNVINVSGSISTASAIGNGGTITLIGGADKADMAGTVTITGTLGAGATGMTGNGGAIETSGATVDFAGATISTASAHGKSGTWLIDPTDLVIGTTADQTTLQNALASGNVTLITSTSGSPTETGVSGIGETGSGNGDITINEPLTWMSANTLILQSANAINLDATITAGKGGLQLTAMGTISAAGAVNVGTFNLTNGNWVQNSATLPAFSATNFEMDPINSSFLRVTGGAGTTAAPYEISDVYGLQGVGSLSLLGYSFVLANSIDASSTVGWNAGDGFAPIGDSGVAYNPTNAQLDFGGTFNGAGHTISGLFVNQPGIYGVGLFGEVNGGTISNLAVVNGTVSGYVSVGGLVGDLFGSTIINSSFSGTVSAATSGVHNSPDFIGGLVGFDQSGTIIGSSASGTVNGALNVGGLVGYINDGRISTSSATNAVNGTSNDVGGLVGYLDSTGVVTDDFATGVVTGNATGGSSVGGLVGLLNNGGQILVSCASGAVSGYFGVGGLLGNQSGGGYVTDAYATGAVSGHYSAGGLIGIETNGSVTRTYATGLVTGITCCGSAPADIAGLIGNDTGAVVTNSIWNTQTTGQSAGYGVDSVTEGAWHGTGLNTAQMLDLSSTATNYTGFNFTSTWSPPTQAGQGGQTAGYYPQLYALTPVVVGTLGDVSRNYGSPNPTFGTQTAGGAASYLIGPTGDTLGPVNFGTTTATADSNVGMYAITGQGGTATSTGGVAYRVIALGSGELTINPLTLTVVTAALTGSITKTYDGTTVATLAPGNYMLSGFVGTDGATVTQTVGAYASANVGSGINVTVGLSNADFTATGTTNLGNYTLPTSATGTIGAITPLTLTGSIGTGSSVYGQMLNPGAVTFTNVPAGVAAPSATVGLTTEGRLSSSGNLNAGTYTGIEGVTALPSDTAGDFIIGAITGNYTVTQASLTASIATGTSVYGSALVPGAVTLTGLIEGDSVTSAGAVASVTGHTSSSGNLNAGTYTGAETLASGTLSGTDAANYTVSNPGVTGTYMVTQLVLTGTLGAGSSVYGVALNPGIVTFDNVIDGDRVGAGAVAIATAGHLSSSGNLNAGTYSGIESVSSLTGADAANYSLSGLTGDYSVSKLVLTGIITTGHSTYGAAYAPGNVIFNNAVAGDAVSAGLITVNSTGNQSSSGNLNVGSYEGIEKLTGLSGADAGNYTVGNIQGSYGVSAAQLSVTIAGGSSVYGAALVPGAVTLGGLIAGDAVTSAGAVVNLTGHTSSSGNLNAGTYAGAESLANGTLSGADAGNYTLVNPGATGNYTVSQLVLTGTLAAGSSVYGAALSPGAVTFNNLIEGDMVSAGAVTINTAGNLSSSGHFNAGTYTGIESVSGLTGADAANYSLAGLAGNYSVSQASLTITYTANTSSRIYGQAPVGLTGTGSATGLIDDDTLTGTAAFTTSAGATANVGTYAVTGAGLTAGSNYLVTTAQAAANASALTITPASLTITYTATPATRTSGSTLAGLTGTASSTGLVNDDTLSGTATFTTPATSASPAGSYAIDGTGLTASSNYTVTYVQTPANASALTLTKALLTGQSLTPFVEWVFPPYRPYIALIPCRPLKVSRYYGGNGQVVLTKVQGGGDCPVP